MEVVSIKYSKTIQTAQYEPETLEVNANLQEGEDFDACVQEIKAKVYAALGRKAKPEAVEARPEVSGPVAETKEEPKEEVKVAEKKVTKKKATKKKVTKKASTGKRVVYDRAVKAHQKSLGLLLHEYYPGWKEDEELKVAAKQASLKLSGADFMNAKGEVLPSFVDLLKEYMGKDDL